MSSSSSSSSSSSNSISWDSELIQAATPYTIGTMSVAAGAFAIACTASSSSITVPAAIVTVFALGALKGIHACGNEAQNLMQGEQGKKVIDSKKVAVNYFKDNVGSHMMHYGAESLGAVINGLFNKRANLILDKVFS